LTYAPTGSICHSLIFVKFFPAFPAAIDSTIRFPVAPEYLCADQGLVLAV
jgi:hypothetical protein